MNDNPKLDPIEDAIAFAKLARNSRPKWTGSWYVIGRAIKELERAISYVPQETQYEPTVTTPAAPAEKICEHPGVFASDKEYVICPHCWQDVKMQIETK